MAIAIPMTAAAEDPAAVWPIYRGDSSLSGLASGTLPERMRLLWTFRTEDQIRSSPVVGQDTVFVGSYDGKVYALELANGTERWSFDTGNAVEAPALLVEDSLYVGSLDGTLYALKAKNGKQRWIYATENRIMGSANWARTREGERILVGSYDNRLHCLESGSGKVAWTFLTDHYINGAPAIYSSGAQILTVFGGCDMLLHLVSVENGLELTAVEAGSFIAASVAVAGYQAFFGNYDGALLCVDLSQARILWEYVDEEVRAPFFSSPAVNEDRVVAGSRDGRLHCVDRSSGQMLWTFPTGGEIDSSPVICGDKVVFGSADGRIYLLNLDDGKELWSYEIGAGIVSSPAVVGDRVIIAAEDGLVYAFGP